ncbi:hypothetical protein D3C85_1221340 [compost metagenome]
MKGKFEWIHEKNKETVENNVIQWLGLAKKCDTNSGSKIVSRAQRQLEITLFPV